MHLQPHRTRNDVGGRVAGWQGGRATGEQGLGAMGESGNRGIGGGEFTAVGGALRSPWFALDRPGSPAKGGQESGKGEDKRDARVYLFAYIWFAFVLVG